MHVSRPWILVLAALAGCAVAIPSGGGPTADASQPGTTDPDARGPDAGAAAACAYSGVLASWTFAGEPGSQTSTAGAASAPGVTAVGISRVASLTASSGADSINASNWPTSAQRDQAKYYTLSITAPAGCTIHVTSLAIDAKSSGTGPASAVVATSADAFAQTAAISTSAASAPALSATSAGDSLEIRIYGFAATGSGGTMRVQNTLTVTGTLQ